MGKIADSWNSRYSNDEYIYGELPNNYLKEKLEAVSPGNILLPGEGEGRNAVYAASKGWEVVAFDISSEGKRKAERLAELHNVEIDYRVGRFKELDLQEGVNGGYDVVALIYTHFAKEERGELHADLLKLLRQGGLFIAEFFSRNHVEFQKVNSSAGGPRDIDFLYSVEDVREEFKDCEILELKEEVIELNEGRYHSGTASVIRFVGRKV